MGHPLHSGVLRDRSVAYLTGAEPHLRGKTWEAPFVAPAQPTDERMVGTVDTCPQVRPAQRPGGAGRGGPGRCLCVAGRADAALRPGLRRRGHDLCRGGRPHPRGQLQVRTMRKAECLFWGNATPIYALFHLQRQREAGLVRRHRRLRRHDGPGHGAGLSNNRRVFTLGRGVLILLVLTKDDVFTGGQRDGEQNGLGNREKKIYLE